MKKLRKLDEDPEKLINEIKKIFRDLRLDDRSDSEFVKYTVKPHLEGLIESLNLEDMHEMLSNIDKLPRWQRRIVKEIIIEFLVLDRPSLQPFT